MPFQYCQLPRAQQQGFSLLEVMIAGGILGYGLAALAALLLSAVSGTAQSGHRSVAASLAESLASQIRISPAAEMVFLTSPPEVVIDCNAENACTAEQFAAAGLKRWHVEVTSSLPGGSSVVCLDGTPHDGSGDSPACDGSGRLAIKLFWRQGARLGPSPTRVVKVPG